MSTSYFKAWINDITSAAIQPALPEAQDTDAMTDRVIILELLYHLDKRHDRTHPHHNTYTGLWQQYKETINP